MAQLNGMQAHRTGRPLHGRLPQYPSHPIPFASRRNRADNGQCAHYCHLHMLAAWTSRVFCPVSTWAQMHVLPSILPLCANGHGQFATRLMTVQGNFEMVSRPVADVISGEALQRFSQEITGISPTVCSFSFSYSTAKVLNRTMRVLISSRGLCFTTFGFRACADGMWDKTFPVAH